MSDFSIPSQAAIKRPIDIPYSIPNFVELRHRSKEKLTFSFCFFDRTETAFNLGGASESWFITLLDVTKEWSKLTWCELRAQSIYDAHPYDEKAKYPLPIANSEQYECFQLRLDKSNGRVHGFLLGSIFYVLWLDPHHNMYDSVGYATKKKFPIPKTAFESLKEEHESLQLEYQSLLELCGECVKTNPHK